MSALSELVGTQLGPTSWIEITQERIDASPRRLTIRSGSTSTPSARPRGRSGRGSRTAS